MSASLSPSTTDGTLRGQLLAALADGGRWLVYSNSSLLLADAVPEPASSEPASSEPGKDWYMAASSLEAMELLGCKLTSGWSRGHATAPRG